MAGSPATGIPNPGLGICNDHTLPIQPDKHPPALHQAVMPQSCSALAPPCIDFAQRAMCLPWYPPATQPFGISCRDNVIKECGEEASIPPELAAQAVPTGACCYGTATTKMMLALTSTSDITVLVLISTTALVLFSCNSR